MKKILLIIPAYNEEDNIKLVIEEIKKNNKYDYIIINDCSTDNTEKICKINNYNYISLVSNLGIGGAVQTGYKYAYDHDYDIAIQFDGDGQHDINSIESLIKPILLNKADMVIGSRFVDNNEGFKSSFSRRIGIRIISFFIKLTTGFKIYDTTSGLRACNKKVIEIFKNEYPVEYPEPVTTTILLRKQKTVTEVPVIMKERKSGISSIRTWKNIYYMINVVLSILIIYIRREK